MDALTEHQDSIEGVAIRKSNIRYHGNPHQPVTYTNFANFRNLRRLSLPMNLFLLDPTMYRLLPSSIQSAHFRPEFLETRGKSAQRGYLGARAALMALFQSKIDKLPLLEEVDWRIWGGSKSRPNACKRGFFDLIKAAQSAEVRLSLIHTMEKYRL